MNAAPRESVAEAARRLGERLRGEGRAARPGPAAATKHCKACGDEKPIPEFYAHPTSRDGRFNTCRACTLQAQRDGRLVRDGRAKACKDCGAVRPIAEFPAHPQMRSGRINVCKACRREQRRRREAARKAVPVAIPAPAPALPVPPTPPSGWTPCGAGPPGSPGRYLVHAPSDDPRVPLVSEAWYEPGVGWSGGAWNALPRSAAGSIADWRDLPDPPAR